MVYSQFIVELLTEASVIAQNMYGQVTGIVKDDDNSQVLTEADLAISHLLISRVCQYYPRHNIVDEEAGVVDNGSDYTWVLDPIDGTSNFAAQVPTYGVMIGLLHNDQPIAGGIALPAFGEVCWAERGKGAFSGDERLAVTNQDRLLSALVAYGIGGHPGEPDRTRRETALLAEIILGIRNLRDSNSCFDVVMLARGKYGGCLNRTSKIWDNVAPQILIEEAGGVYTSFFGEPMDYSDPLSRIRQNFECCAATPALHVQLQTIIHGSKAE